MIRVNKYGVRCAVSSIGSCWKDERGIINAELLIPVFCLSCKYYDNGEVGDYGNLLTGPGCTLNLHFPTRKGTCGRFKPR